MKYNTVINNAGIIDAGFGEGKTDLVDWAIVDYINCWATNPTATRIGDLVWINYRHMINEMPLLGLNTKQAVSKRIIKLRGLGILRTQYDEDGRVYAGLTMTSHNAINFRVAPVKELPVNPGVHPVNGDGHPVNGDGHSLDDQISESDKEEIRLDQLSIDHEFDRFWHSGIRKVSKKKTAPLFEKYLKANPQMSYEDLTDRLIADVKARIESGQLGFTEMHPTTYFNGERWTDEIIDKRWLDNGRHGQAGKKLSHADIVRDQARRHLEALDKADREANDRVISADGDFIPGESQRLQNF